MKSVLRTGVHEGNQAVHSLDEARRGCIVVIGSRGFRVHPGSLFFGIGGFQRVRFPMHRPTVGTAREQSESVEALPCDAQHLLKVFGLGRSGFAW